MMVQTVTGFVGGLAAVKARPHLVLYSPQRPYHDVVALREKRFIRQEEEAAAKGLAETLRSG